MEVVEQMIMKWDPDASACARVTSLFYEEKEEPDRFVK